MRKFTQTLIAIGFVVVSTAGVRAAEVHVMISGGLTAAFKRLVPEFEKATGNTVVVAYGPSMGTTPQAIPMRLSRGEPADVLIMVGDALGDLIEHGQALADSRVDIADSPIGVAVKAGAARPDIATPDALKQTLLNAKSVAYSDSASGVYVGKELFEKLNIADAMKGKARSIPATPVGEIVARGDADIGFQQISELKPVHGIDIIGPLPAELQKITVFSAGLASKAPQPAAGRALIAYLGSKQAAPVIVETGLVPRTK